MSNDLLDVQMFSSVILALKVNQDDDDATTCGCLLGSHDMNLIPLWLWLGKAQEVGNIRNPGRDALDDVDSTLTFCLKFARNRLRWHSQFFPLCSKLNCPLVDIHSFGLFNVAV